MRKPNFEGISAKKMCILESFFRSRYSLPRLVRFPAFWFVLVQRRAMSFLHEIGDQTRPKPRYPPYTEPPPPGIPWQA